MSSCGGFRDVRARGNGVYETNVKGFRRSARVQMQRFTMPKSKGCYRIFCVGESSVQGWPYCMENGAAGPAKSFPVQLQKLLRKRHENIEVINAGIGAACSAEIDVLVKQLVKFQPDCIIMYVGHNEYGYYYWSRNALKIPQIMFKADAMLSRLYLYRFLLRLTHRGFSGGEDAWTKFPRPGNSLDWPMVYEKYRDAVPSKEWESFSRNELFLCEKEFEKNLSEIDMVLKQNKIDFVVCTVVSNLKDCFPCVTFHSAKFSRQDLKVWEKKLADARKALDERRYKRAVLLLEGLLRLDDYYAEIYYLLGQAYYAEGDFEAARRNFTLARDNSPACAPFQRAPSSCNNLIRAFAKKKEISLVDIEKGFYSRPDDFGIPGNDLFFDNLHPNEKGYRLIAKLIAERIDELEIIPPAKKNPY